MTTQQVDYGAGLLEKHVKELEALVLLLPGVVTSAECNVCEQPKHKLHLWHCIDRNPDLYRQPDGSIFQGVSVEDAGRNAGIAEAVRCIRGVLGGGSLTERLLLEHLTAALHGLLRANGRQHDTADLCNCGDTGCPGCYPS